jgi:hypothetical protein
MALFDRVERGVHSACTWRRHVCEVFCSLMAAAQNRAFHARRLRLA